ncbi:MAG: SurA N-terminal domain-containing protein, partial [Gemmatimonadales bacterium]
MLRTMRANAKWVFLIVAGSFVLWLGIGQVTEILGPSGTVVLRVNGQDVQVARYQQLVQNAREQFRLRFGTAPMTLEGDQELQDQVIQQLVDSIVLYDEYDRLGIRVSDTEVIEAARSSPPAEVMQNPEFQTNGQFDIAKWQRFLQTGADPGLLLQLEALYRDRILRYKLAQYATSDVYISDGKLWQLYHDEYDSVRVAVLPVWPAEMPDSSPISDDELRRYVEEHEDEFTRPAMAFVRFVVQSRVPNAADSAAARAAVARIRA